jgi:ribonuclease BN (tRNA processing enzyme)
MNLQKFLAHFFRLVIWFNLALALHVLVGVASGQTTNNAPTGAPREPFVVFLGTGTPGPTPNRQGPSLAVVAGGKAYLVDVGVGVVRQASAAYSNGIRELQPRALEIAFITHLHSDHTMGLPDLIFTPWVIGRSAPLELYGPPGISAMAGHILEAYAEDIHVRTTGLEQANLTGYKVNAHEEKPGLVFQDANVKVTAFAVPHGSWPLALGYRFDAGGKSIVISGDTSPAESVVQACKGCDLLIHEVHFGLPTSTAHPPDHWAKYMAAFHTSAEQLSDIAARAHAKTLAATHLALMSGTSETDLATALQRSFRGRVVVAHDLEVVTP